MKNIESGRTFPFGGEVIVELQGIDENGEIDIVSYQFAPEESSKSLTPKETIEDEHVSIVSETLENEGYRLQMQND